MAKLEALGKAASPRTSLLVCGIFIVAVASMAGSVGGEFIFDDIPLIVGNHYVHSFEHWARWFTSTLWDTNFDPTLVERSRGFWRPVIVASYAWDWFVGGGSPVPFHITNLIVHGLNTVLLFFVLRAWLPTVWGPVIGALFFGVHPAQTEPVAWIAGRTDVFCALGMLVATLGLRVGERSFRGAVIILLGLFVAVSAKEAVVVFPILVFIEALSAVGFELNSANFRRVMIRVVPFVALILLYVAGRQFFTGALVGSGGDTYHQAHHGVLVVEALGRYLSLAVWPQDVTLGAALLPFEGGSYAVTGGYAALGAVLITGTAGCCLFLWRKSPRIALGALAFLGMLVPVSGVIWLGYDVLVSPRFLYEPLICVGFLVGALVDYMSRRRPTGLVFGGILIIALAIFSFQRSRFFDSEAVFWRAEIEANEHHPSAHDFFILQELRAGRPRAALKLSHHWYQARLRAGEPEAELAPLLMRSIEAMVALTPDIDVSGLLTLRDAIANLRRGHHASFSAAALGLSLEVQRGSRLSRALPQRQYYLPLIEAQLLSRAGHDVPALDMLDQAISNCHQCWRVLKPAAIVLARAGKLDRANQVALAAEELAPPGELVETLHQLRRLAQLHHRLQASRDASPVASTAFYTASGAFGRAYRAAHTAYAALPSEPGVRRRLAELAFRAGDEQQARAILLQLGSEADVTAWVAQVGQSVGWKENPEPAGRWAPKIAMLPL